MKKCSVCGHSHCNSELRCQSCADQNLRPTDKYIKPEPLKIKKDLKAIEFQNKIMYVPTYRGD